METLTRSYRIICICFFAIAFITITSCHKEGTGGKATINGYVKHHNDFIPNAVVYIKYGATEFPGTDVSGYDASVTASADAYYEIKDLYRGDYYLYGVGYDTAIGQPVRGGVAVKLKTKTSTTTMNVPVSE